jgi:hypothetical protein
LKIPKKRKYFVEKRRRVRERKETLIKVHFESVSEIYFLCALLNLVLAVVVVRIYMKIECVALSQIE